MSPNTEARSAELSVVNPKGRPEGEYPSAQGAQQ